MTHKKSKTAHSIADVLSCFSFVSSTLSAVEQLFMWQALIKWSPRNPKNATSSAKKNVCQQVQPQFKTASFFRNTQTAQQNPLNFNNNVWNQWLFMLSVRYTLKVLYKATDLAGLGCSLLWTFYVYRSSRARTRSCAKTLWTKTTCMLLITAKIGQCINSDLCKSVQVRLSNNFSLSVTEG